MSFQRWKEFTISLFS